MFDIEKLQEMSIQDLRKLAREKGIEIDRKDNKQMIIEKLKIYASNMTDRVIRQRNIREKMSRTKKVIVTPMNPEDRRDSELVTITNATGSYSYVVPFNTPVELPEPIIKNLKQRQYQGFRKKYVKGLGQIDESFLAPAYTVQEVNE